MLSPNLLIPCEVSDKATLYSATSSIFSWSVLRKARVHRNGTIFYKSVQVLAVAEDIDIIRRTMRDVTVAFSAI